MFNQARPTFSQILLSAAAAGTFPALGATPIHSFHSSRAIGTTLDIQIATQSPLAADQACTRIHNEISRLELMLSTRIPTSFISQINATQNPVTVPHEVIELLTAYNHASTLTAGIISPLTGNLTARWSQAARENTLPQPQELQTLVAQIQNTTLKIDPIASTVQRLGPATLNIDALGKPFILAKAATAGNHPSLTGLLINIGGDILAVAPVAPWRKPGAYEVLGTPETPWRKPGAYEVIPWLVNITNPQNPADNAPPLATLNLVPGATDSLGATGLRSSQTRAMDARLSVVTSGDYARPHLIANQTFSHILDARTGLPASHGIAATVMHENPILANVLATAFCILGPDAAHLAKQLNAQYLLCANRGVSPVFLISEKLPLAANAATGATQPSTQPGGWPKNFIASLALNIVSTGRPEREYIAVWVEDQNGKYVKTLALWGTDKYQNRALTLWTRLGVNSPPSVTTATKNAGSYTINWDGTDFDLKPVPQSKYTIRVESGTEHSGHYSSKTVLTTAGEKATATVPKSGAIDTSTITYAPPKTKS